MILTQDHVGKEIRSVITFEDNFGLIRSLSSNITSPIQNINDLPQGLPLVNGDTLIGNSLSYNLSDLYDEDGLGDISTMWQSSYDNITWQDVSSDSNLSLDDNLLGQTVRLKASYTDNFGTLETIYSNISEKIYGYSNNEIIFPDEDDPDQNNIKITSDLSHSNSFKFNFDLLR